MGDGTHHGLVVIHTTDSCTSSFAPEVVGQTIGLYAVPCPTIVKYTDSKSGLQLHTKATRPLTSAFLPLLCPYSAGQLCHTKAHPERRKKYAEYTAEDTGIDKADALASADMMRFRRDNPRGIVKHIMARDLYEDLLQHTIVPVTTTFTGQLCLRDIQEMRDQKEYSLYLTRRDQYRNERLQQPPTTTHWRNTSVHIAASLQTRVFDRGRSAQLTRQLWHWGFTGYNQAKTGAPELSACTLCHHHNEDEAHVMWHCTHPNMVAVRQRHIRFLNALNASRRVRTHQARTQLYQLHQLLLCPDNYSLLLGRVHAYQRRLVDGLFPHNSTASQQQNIARSLVRHWKPYRAMVIEIYNERERLIRHWQQRRTLTVTTRPSRLTLNHNEMLHGIETYMLIHPTGEPVRNTHYDPSAALIAQQRDVLTSTNSVFLRTIAPKKTTNTRQRPAPQSGAVHTHTVDTSVELVPRSQN
jgi:hypothetical protein